MKTLAEIKARKKAIGVLLNGDGEIDIDALEAEMRELDTEEAKIEKRNVMLAALNAGAGQPVPGADNPNVNPEERKEINKFGTVEYRKQFMEFCRNGTPIGMEYRADAFTTTTDASAVIPSTILDEVIKEMKTYGQIFSRIRSLNIKGGVTVPILSLKPVATWITQATPSDRLKVTANTSVSFSYYGLECKVAVSLLSETVSLSSFETTIIGLIAEAMIKAIDIAIIKGSGTGEPLGVTLDPRVPAGQIITLSAADFVQWDSWKKKVFAKIPLTYRAGGSFIMAAGTFEGYIDGMVDANGQPIGRINYGITDAPQERFGGREVILVEDDVVTPYDTAAVADVVAVYCKLGDYAINSNMQMQMFRWLDHDTNQWVDKALLIADGKILDPNGVVIVKKGA